MQRFWHTLFTATAIALVAALALQTANQATAAQKKGKRTLVIEGKIERVPAKDHVIVRTTDDKEVTVYVSPKTTYVFAGKTVEFSNLKTGQIIFVEYDQEEDRFVATRIGDLTLVDGEVVRVIDKDQVVVRTADRKEVIVYVHPETRFQLTTSGGTISDLRPGMNINVYYNVHEQRNQAHRVFLPRKK